MYSVDAPLTHLHPRVQGFQQSRVKVSTDATVRVQQLNEICCHCDPQKARPYAELHRFRAIKREK